MDKKMSEEEVRRYVAKLKNFYSQVSVYAFVNICLIFIWLFSGAGAFWPIWTIVIWGVALGFQALKIGLFPKEVQQFMDALMDKLPFLKGDWEEEQVKDIMKDGKPEAKKDASSPKKTAVKTEKKVSKKKVVKKAGPTKKPSSK